MKAKLGRPETGIYQINQNGAINIPPSVAKTLNTRTTYKARKNKKSISFVADSDGSTKIRKERTNGGTSVRYQVTVPAEIRNEDDVMGSQFRVAPTKKGFALQEA